MKFHLLSFAFVLMVLPLAGKAEQGADFTRFAGFELENNSTLSDVEKKIGPANLIESGDAGGYEAKICYITPNGTVSFLSGELGGPDHELQGFSVAVTTQESKKICSMPKPNIIPPELTVNGLRLGMTRSAFNSVLTSNSRWDGNTGTYIISFTRPLTPDEIKHIEEFWPDVAERPYADVLISISGTFNRGILVEYQVWKVSTV